MVVLPLALQPKSRTLVAPGGACWGVNGNCVDDGDAILILSGNLRIDGLPDKADLTPVLNLRGISWTSAFCFERT